MTTPQALEGIRVLVMEDFVVLPWASMLLGDLGAEVIRIEAPTRLVSRQFTPFPEGKAGPQWWNESGAFDLWYRNKKSVVLNIQSPEGKEIFHDLVKICDVVASNFRADVMARLGLSYEELRKLRPDLIMVNVTGFGQTGPWKNYGAFARTIDGFTGLSHLTGYVNGPPVRANATYMDMTGALNNAQAILLAILQREQTGKGAHIDAGMYETGVSAIGPAILKTQQNGEVSPRRGNGHETMAPHGCYKCLGEDRWVVIAVDSDEAWTGLKSAMGNPKWTNTCEYSNVAGRLKNREQIDVNINDWTSTQEAYDVFHSLQANGVAAAPVLNGKDILLDPQYEAMGFFEKFTKNIETVGTRIHQKVPYRLSQTPGYTKMMACFGEHNRNIIVDLLGKTDEELSMLVEHGVIFYEPDPQEQQPPPSPDRNDLVARKVIQIYDADYRTILAME